VDTLLVMFDPQNPSKFPKTFSFFAPCTSTPYLSDFDLEIVEDPDNNGPLPSWVKYTPDKTKVKQDFVLNVKLSDFQASIDPNYLTYTLYV